MAHFHLVLSLAAVLGVFAGAVLILMPGILMRAAGLQFAAPLAWGLGGGFCIFIFGFRGGAGGGRAGVRRRPSRGGWRPEKKRARGYQETACWGASSCFAELGRGKCRLPQAAFCSAVSGHLSAVDGLPFALDFLFLFSLN